MPASKLLASQSPPPNHPHPHPHSAALPTHLVLMGGCGAPAGGGAAAGWPAGVVGWTTGERAGAPPSVDAIATPTYLVLVTAVVSLLAVVQQPGGKTKH